ncbi:DNA alkylation repair protein [Oligella ureolytica]|nr:DNA alkylation repair protein [Oligella sp.]
MLTIQRRLFELADTGYARFQSNLIPTLDKNTFIGVRVPILRQLAKQYASESELELFLQSLPHQYYDENMLHAILISQIKGYEECLEAVNGFLPYIDNWAVCDILSPKTFKINRQLLLHNIHHYAASEHIYTCRFAIVMLMSHYLDDDFKTEYLDIPATIRTEQYYVNMAIAWFFATALAKQWESTIPYLQEQRLAPWVHNKTIQKARESFRITKEQKAYLAALKQ